MEIRPTPFIVGAPRSGTTLLRLMLDGHPQLAIPPETHFVAWLVQNPAAAADARSLWQLVVTSHRWDDFHLQPGLLLDRLLAVDGFSLSAGLRCFYAMYAERFGKTRWGDKTPRYGLSMREIAQSLPEAHFVHLIRDGRDVALSHRSTWWTAMEDDIAGQAREWKGLVQDIRRHGRQVAHYIEIRYEDLVENPEGTLASIGHFIHLPFDPRQLRYYEAASQRLQELGDLPGSDGSMLASAAQRRGIHALTRLPPQRSRAGRWRLELSAAEKEAFRSAAGDLLAELGYDP